MLERGGLSQILYYQEAYYLDRECHRDQLRSLIQDECRVWVDESVISHGLNRVEVFKICPCVSQLRMTLQLA